MNKKDPEFLKSLLEKACKGDAQAWHDLIDLIAPVIFSICRKSRLSRDESFDVFGQICYELIRDIKKIKSPQALFSFVATITRRKIYGYFQRINLMEYIDPHDSQAVSGDAEDVPEQIYEQVRRRELILDAIDELPDRDGKLLKMLFLDPDRPSYEEISRSLDMPQASIGPTRGRALEKLYRILKRRKFKL